MDLGWDLSDSCVRFGNTFSYTRSDDTSKPLHPCRLEASIISEVWQNVGSPGSITVSIIQKPTCKNMFWIQSSHIAEVSVCQTATTWSRNVPLWLIISFHPAANVVKEKQEMGFFNRLLMETHVCWNPQKDDGWKLSDRFNVVSLWNGPKHRLRRSDSVCDWKGNEVDTAAPLPRGHCMHSDCR